MTSSDLPSGGLDLRWENGYTLSNSFESVKAYVDKLRDFWTEIEILQKSLFVIGAENQSLGDIKRRIAIGI